MKESGLLELHARNKLHLIAICEVKPKNISTGTELDYKIFVCLLHPVNNDWNIRRSIVIYTKLCN